MRLCLILQKTTSLTVKSMDEQNIDTLGITFVLYSQHKQTWQPSEDTDLATLEPQEESVAFFRVPKQGISGNGGLE